MNSNTINENIVTAMDILITKRLENLKYNVTKICTIIDNSKKQLGKYTVQEEVIQYEAYSENTTFNIGDSVLVMIPNGDYNEQKIILNKVAIDTDLTSSVAYTSPLKTMLSFTDNIIEKDLIQPDIDSGVKNKKYFSLLANGENKVGELNPEVFTSKLLYSIPWQTYNNYEKIGISADFQTWLKDLDASSGEYGLELLFFNSKTTLRDQQEKKSTYRFTFGLNDILGDPYNFPTYFTQEKVIDVSQLQDITSLQIYLFQKGNFKTDDGTYILNSYEGNKLPDNIFVGNIKLYVGYDINKYSSDAVTLSTFDPLTYSQKRTVENNTKHLTLHWVHKLDDYNYEIIDGTNIGDKEIEVYWVRADNSNQNIEIMDIVGAGWNNSEQELKVDLDNQFKCNLLIDGSGVYNTLAYEDLVKVKAVCRIKDDDNWLQYESNLLSFETEDVAFNSQTYNAVTGLSIWCDDGGYQGNYFIYGDDNKIIDESKGSGYYRKFVLYYDGTPIEDNTIDGLEIEQVTWTLPVNAENSSSTTMLSYPNIDLSKQEIKNQKIKHNVGQSTTLNYRISDIWYPSIASNTVSCNIKLKNQDIYKTSKELLFGKAGSQGSNYNIVIEYKKPGQNAFELVTNDTNQVESNSTSTELICKVFNISGAVDFTDVEKENCKWDWKLYDGMPTSGLEPNCTTFQFSNGNKTSSGQSVGIKYIKEKLEEKNNCAIIEVIFTPPDSNDRKIIAYKPIAIKTKESQSGQSRCASMSGAHQVNYVSSGPPSYSTDSYKLYDSSNGFIPGIEWTTFRPDDGLPGYPELKPSGNNEKALSAAPFYIDNINYKFSVIAKKGNTIYWIQPIQITYSRYELGIINEWDGTTATMDGGTIMAATVAVGKNSDDGFSGIVLGDMLLDKSSQNSTTGLYGISKGKTTFSLTDNGLATFGKINNDENILSFVNVLFGDDNDLLSHSNPVYDKDGKENGYTNYLHLDLDDGFFELAADTSKPRGLLLQADGDPYLKVISSNGKDLLEFSNDRFVLKSDGASDSTGLTFNVEKGIMRLRTGSYLALNSTDNHFGQKSTDGDLMQVGKLKINKDGEVYYNNQTLTAYIKELIKEATD